MRIISCMVMGLICLLALPAALRAGPLADPVDDRQEKSDLALEKCLAVMRQYADSPDLEAKLKDPLAELLKVPYAMRKMCELFDAHPDKAVVILSVMKKCDKVDVLTVLERLGQWGSGYEQPDLTREVAKKCRVLDNEILDSIPADQQLALAEKSERPREWARRLADRFYKSEPKRVETLYCRWAQVELGAKGASDADEMHESDESIYEQDFLNRLVEMNTDKTIHEAIAAIDLRGDGASYDYVVSNTLDALDKVNRPEVTELYWRIARVHVPADEEPVIKLGMISGLSSRVDADGIDQLLKALDNGDNYNNYTDHASQIRTDLLARKAELIRQASTQPASTQPAGNR